MVPVVVVVVAVGRTLAAHSLRASPERSGGNSHTPRNEWQLEEENSTLSHTQYNIHVKLSYMNAECLACTSCLRTWIIHVPGAYEQRAPGNTTVNHFRRLS